MNRTRSLYKNALKHAFDVKIFGPGYVDSETLGLGLDAFIDKHGPFDCTITNEQVLFSVLIKDRLLKAYWQHGRRFDDQDLLRLPSLSESFQNLAGRKAVFLLQTDTYHLRDEKLRMIEDSDDYIIGWGRQFVEPLENLEDLKKEQYFQSANDNYFNFVQNNDSRVISLPAFLSEEEFSDVPLGSRAVKWSVLGARYWARAETEARLKNAGVPLSGFTPQTVIERMRKYRLIDRVKAEYYDVSNYLFRKSLSQSKYSYTCGSALRLPIRKFFEIPAQGTILVCIPCNGSADIGLTDKSTIVASRPEDIIDAHEFLEEDPERAQRIADAGRNIVWRKHTAISRSRQIKTALKAIEAGSFAGSRWVNGDFQILERQSV
ncbi:MAG: glycosyltransferase [Alphaproteobacteria bacterium]|nr:glycosyltransferase [Alphaproteobacteria bacterium]